MDDVLYYYIINDIPPMYMFDFCLVNKRSYSICNNNKDFILLKV